MAGQRLNMGGADAYIDHSDAVGSTTMETDPAGVVQWDVVHYPWGRVFQEQGVRQSEVVMGLDWQVNDPVIPSATREFNFEDYRWMTPDPDNAGSDVSDSQSWNMYSYGGDNPTTNTDPTGEACVQGSDGGYFDDNNGGQTCAEAFLDKPGTTNVTANAPKASYLTAPFILDALIIAEQFQTAAQLVTNSGRDAYSGFVNLFLNNKPSGGLQLGLGIAGLASGGEGEEAKALIPLGEELSGRVSKAIEAAEAGIKRYPGKDGIIFENREKLLPLEPYGYYHEYTVDPVGGTSGRGAERIVTGLQGEVYYTNNHYQPGSFARIR